jgi:hypothetical protein
MKLVLNLFLFLFALFIFEKKLLSLSYSQIKNICKNELRESTCIKNLKEKKNNLQKGKQIEIPVIPYKR